ncbi:ATP-binding cassette domain-containing protein [Neomicrococcus lactis]|uniref:ABC-type polysaccharide/polyol phosphate transport system ATPase subunit n=1 Tax=Neomicrococcus lactis TaxID=732241 RepID=A0A7W8Y9U2_9MICC|nr:hypothetical protein [Neomicrococcus lactis]MBB5597496.1 ABC-type polysaccharide/polyol phosphate transport system ATPase subunit [Neomicrococcus lactis]
MTSDSAERRPTLVVKNVYAEHRQKTSGRQQSAGGPRLEDVSFHVVEGESIGILGTTADGIGLLSEVICGRLEPVQGDVYVRPGACLLEAPTPAELQQSLYETIERFAMTQDVNGRALKKAVQRTVRQSALDENQLLTRVADLEASVVDLAKVSAALNTSPSVLLATSSVATGNALLADPGNVWFERYIARGGAAVIFGQTTRTMVRACSRIIWLHEGRVLMDRPAVEVHRAKAALDENKTNKTLMGQYIRRYQQEYVAPRFGTF